MSERDAFKKLLEEFNTIEDSVGKNDIEVEVASPIKVRLLAELKARQLKDPKTEVMVVKNNKVIVIDKKDLPKYVDDGWALAEAHGGKHTTTGRSMTKGEEKEKERLVKGMKKNKSDFKKRYGKDADAVMYATATKKAMEDDDSQVMSFEQMDKIYSGLKNAIDLYEKLVGDIEDPMADFTDDLGSDIVNYTKQGPLSSAPEIKNIENLSQSQMLTLASVARQAIDLAQSDVGANVTDIPAAEEFVKKLEVAIKGVKELDTKDLQRFPANVMKGKKKEKGGTDRDKAYFKMQQKRKEKQTAEAELAVKKQDLGGMLVDRFNAFFRKATPEEIKAMAQLLDYKTRDEDKEFVKIEKEDIEETMFAENDKECPPGQYYCNDEQKCKPIPAGHEVEPDGNLKPIQKDAKQVLIDFQAKINEFAKNLGVTPKMLFAGLIEKNPELADNPIAKKIGEYSKALTQSK